MVAPSTSRWIREWRRSQCASEDDEGSSPAECLEDHHDRSEKPGFVELSTTAKYENESPVCGLNFQTQGQCLPHSFCLDFCEPPKKLHMKWVWVKHLVGDPLLDGQCRD